MKVKYLQIFVSLLRSFGVLVFVKFLVQQASFGALIVSDDVTFNAGSGVADFVITFNSTPDFFTLDSVGRQDDSFQFFIRPSPTLPSLGGPFYNVTTIIRGEEIHVGGDIRLRDVAPTSSDPSSGGWGPLRGSVPFSISGASVNFSVPMALLGVTGDFSYDLQGYNFGIQNYNLWGTTANVSPPVTPVPEPSTGIAGIFLLGMLGLSFLRKGGLALSINSLSTNR